MERCAHWAPCFWLISPKWLTFQTKDMHIRELNNKVLGKSAIKKGGHYSRGKMLGCQNQKARDKGLEDEESESLKKYVELS